MRHMLQHWCNELSLYCRLKDCGVPQRLALRVSAGLGRLLNRLIYRSK